jgi:hypothetical protein
MVPPLSAMKTGYRSEQPLDLHCLDPNKIPWAVFWENHAIN